MNIDRDTYEAWLLDRLEGRLTAEQERALDAFLAANPDLQAGPGDLPSIDAGAASFGDLASLKRTYPPQGLPDAARIDEFLIARGEGDLGAEQVKAVERFLFEHPEHERAARLVAAARIASSAVPLPGKEKLEKHFPPIGLPDRERIGDFLIAAAEGDLDAAQRKALATLVASDAALQHQQRLVNAARVPREAVVFAGKSSLKKAGGRVVPLWSFGSQVVRYAAAASVVLVLGMGLWVLRSGGGGTTQVAVLPEASVPNRGAGGAVGVVPGVGGGASTQIAAPAEVGERPVPAQRSVTPARRRASQPGPSRVEPRVAERRGPERSAPVKVEVPSVPFSQEPDQGIASASDPRGTAVQPRTVSELLVAGVRERVLDEPTADDRPLDKRDAVALADKGLKGITGGTGGVQVERSAKRDRFKVRLGDGLAFSGSIGR
jgi:hypothetical protein